MPHGMEEVALLAQMFFRVRGCSTGDFNIQYILDPVWVSRICFGARGVVLQIEPKHLGAQKHD